MKQVIYETEVKVKTFDADENGEKIESTEEFDSADTFQQVHIFADEGKVFRRISDGEVLTAHIGIGTFDSVDNYEEVDADGGTD